MKRELATTLIVAVSTSILVGIAKGASTQVIAAVSLLLLAVIAIIFAAFGICRICDVFIQGLNIRVTRTRKIVSEDENEEQSNG